MILNIFFSIKLIRQFRWGKKKFQGGKLPKVLPKSTIFQNPGGAAGLVCIRPWMQQQYSKWLITE
jgi:hypothetical protein